MIDASPSRRPTGRRRLYDTVCAVLDVPPDAVSSASSPETMPAWDSLNHLNLAMALEAEFEVVFSPDDLLRMRDVMHIETVLREHGVVLE